MLASSLGTTVASVMFIQPIHTFGVEAHKGSVPVEALLMFGSSMFVCWLIYRVRAEQEDSDAVHVRQNDALAFVSHELRHPLATVQLAASMLERDRSEETRARATKLILSSAARLGRVVDDLVDVTRLQREGLRINSAVLRLQDPILAAVDAAAPAIAQRQQCLEAVVATTPSLWVNGDEGRLQQVFENLLSNASRYSPEGAEITVTSRQEGTAAVVTVRDTGAGYRPGHAGAHLRSLRAGKGQRRRRARHRTDARAQSGESTRWAHHGQQRWSRTRQHLHHRAPSRRGTRDGSRDARDGNRSIATEVGLIHDDIITKRPGD